MAELHLLRDACREAEGVVEDKGRRVVDEEWGDEDVLGEGVRRIELSGKEGESENETGDLGDGADFSHLEWTAEEMQLATPCAELVKVLELLCNIPLLYTQYLLCEIPYCLCTNPQVCCEVVSNVCRVLIRHGCHEKERQVLELDEAAVMAGQFSEMVDELVDELPAPLDCQRCRKAGGKMANSLTHFLHQVNTFHFCQAAGSKWSSEGYLDTVRTLAEQISPSAHLQPLS